MSSRDLDLNEWDGKLVIEHMVEAWKVLYDVSERVSPKSNIGNVAMEHLLTKADKNEQAIAGTNSVGRMRARIQRTTRECSRMESVFLGFKVGRDDYKGWSEEFLCNHFGTKNCFDWFIRERALCELRNIKFKAKPRCKSKGWSYSTYKRRKEEGGRMIAAGLNGLGIAPW